MSRWRIIHKPVTESTNRDAIEGCPGDVFTAGYQSAGRGRLDHKWHSRSGENLMMSVVLDVAEMDPAQVATLPLVVGLSVAESVRTLGVEAMVKWPNDVLVGAHKLCGILCERMGDRVIAGVGVNVRQTDFPEELAACATSLKLLCVEASVDQVRDLVLAQLGRNFDEWRERGFAAVLPRIQALDALKGRTVEVRQLDDDASPVVGVCNGIAHDGALLVGSVPVFAGTVIAPVATSCSPRININSDP